MKKKTPQHHRGYLAVLTTWQRKARIEQVLSRRWLKVGADDPAGLIAAARKLYPRYVPNSVDVSSFDYPGIRPAPRHKVYVSYGTDRRGVYWSISITVDAAAARSMAFYLMAHKVMRGVTVSAEFTGAAKTADDDGGEVLTVPTVSAAMLAKMQTPTTVLQ
jgi:hypothetical protein